MNWKEFYEEHRRKHPDCTYGDRPHFVPPSLGDPGFFMCEAMPTPAPVRLIITAPDDAEVGEVFTLDDPRLKVKVVPRDPTYGDRGWGR